MEDKFNALFIFALVLTWKSILSQSVDQEFSPNVVPQCRAGFMDIKVNVNTPYHGVVYIQDYRKEPCMVKGNGRSSVTLRLPLITDETNPDYCGVRVNKTTQEKYVHVFVRFHDMLELADDKMYKIRCGLSGYTARNETNFVDFFLLNTFFKSTTTAVLNERYILRGKILGPDRSHVMRVRECLAFDEGNTSLALTDSKGCPLDSSIEPFVYNDTAGTADAVINKMFKFQESSRVNFQCDVYICSVPCKEEYVCASRPERLIEANNQEGRALPGSPNSIEDGGRVQAGTSVFVVPPGSLGGVENDECPVWLWILCIALVVLFIIMMIINIFLCSAMTCSCSKTEVIEKEPSIIEEYDPYRSWHGSHYGSRYSLNGKGYTSAASTMNSARSISSHSDHYAIVHRPDSRYSGNHSMRDPSQRIYKSPPSTAGSHYSNRI